MQPIVLLPSAFHAWVAERALGAPGADVHAVPWYLAGRAPGCASPFAEEPRIVVLSPRDGSVLQADRVAGPSHDAIDVAAETHGLAAEQSLEVLVDGRVASRLEAPYRARITLGRGDHTVEIRPADSRVAAFLGRASVSVR